MTFERIGTGLVCALLVATGAFAWWLALRPAWHVDATALASLPLRVGAWQGRDEPLEQAVESVLRADFNLQRVYRHASGEWVWLYLGYYGTTRGGRPEHTPRGCYTGAGWGIEAARSLPAGAAGGLRVNEYRVERNGERRLVHFWYRSERRTGMLGGLDQNLDRIRGRLLEGRADGALVRVSTPLVAGEETLARARLRSFAAELDPLIGVRWPTERPVTNGARDGPG